MAGRSRGAAGFAVPTRHSIWTPILYEVQRHLFPYNLRLDDHHLYIRNAVEDPADKTARRKSDAAVAVLEGLIHEHQPPLMLCFGQFAFEIARRAWQEKEEYKFDEWTVEKLAEQFSNSIAAFRPETVNILPLLHAVVARGKFLHCHKNCSGGKENYFEYAGEEIAKVLVEHQTHPRISSLLVSGKASLPISA